jgi:hypothetical protein
MAEGLRPTMPQNGDVREVILTTENDQFSIVTSVPIGV